MFSVTKTDLPPNLGFLQRMFCHSLKTKEFCFVIGGWSNHMYQLSKRDSPTKQKYKKDSESQGNRE